jgi:cytochrome c-type biogenesis protein CcmH/NrfG
MLLSLFKRWRGLVNIGIVTALLVLLGQKAQGGEDDAINSSNEFKAYCAAADAENAAQTLKAAKALVHKFPNHHSALFALGDAYRKLGRLDDAIAAFRQATLLKPDDYDAWSCLGLAYDANDKMDEAIAAFRRVLKINPNDSEVWNALGNVLIRQNKCDDAIRAYRQAVRLDPESIEAWYELGRAYVKQGNTAEAMEALQRLRKISPNKAAELNTLIKQ